MRMSLRSIAMAAIAVIAVGIATAPRRDGMVAAGTVWLAPRRLGWGGFGLGFAP
jgi:hypothetical protein